MSAGPGGARQPGPRHPGRLLDVELGTVRVGLAVSDPSGRVATPLETLAVGTGEEAADVAVRLATVAREEACEAVVIGLPRALSGRDTASTTLAREVADALRSQGITVEFWDERLSSAEAERVLLRAGRRRDRRREVRDRVAATIILQGWLDAHTRTE
jgi:putative holliday junction resolvase